MEGNQMKMREAMVQVRSAAHSYINACDDETDRIMSKMVAICDCALSDPPRNCDVGTAGEQTKRFSDFCEAHRHTDLPRCAGCPLENTPSDTGCSFAWAQMPYQEGE